MATESKKDVDSLEDDFSPKHLLSRSLVVIKREIEKLLETSKTSRYALDADSIKALNDLTRTLVVMDKNKNKGDDDDDDSLARLSDEELMALAKKITAPAEPKKKAATKKKTKVKK